jgi:hypothetical protein
VSRINNGCVHLRYAEIGCNGLKLLINKGPLIEKKYYTHGNQRGHKQPASSIPAQTVALYAATATNNNEYDHLSNIISTTLEPIHRKQSKVIPIREISARTICK